ncbi:hypothetical protein HG532_11830 [Moraxella osloensis]|nr:zonular occludens toxin domain-containing protein [Moraxella osloensis]MBW4010689.1 hypothetical protein [Moraxella osloensis]
MLYLVTGTPGTGKTAMVVSKLDKIESQNKVNLVKNKAIFEHNKKIIEKHNLQNDFSIYEYETGTGETLKRELIALDDDYFDMFAQDFDDLRPDDYYLRSIRFNEIANKITDLQGIEGFKEFLPVRTIYTNIANLKIDYVRALKYDWRECPDGSVQVIDEVQLVEPYSDVKAKNNEIVQELTIHRHRGFDFYFLTQAPSLLHPTVKELIGCHWHLTKPYGLKTQVYQFGSCRPYPNTMANKMNAETKFGFSPPARIYKLYKSTTINTHKARLPMRQIVVFGALISAALFMFYYGFFSDSGKKGMFTNDKNANDNVASAVAKTANPSSASSVVAVASAPNSGDGFVSDSDKEYQRLQQLAQIEQLQYERKLKTMPSNVIAFGNNCTAYNTDGLPLDISLSDCKKYALGKKQTLKKMQSMQVSNTLPSLPASAPI